MRKKLLALAIIISAGSTVAFAQNIKKLEVDQTQIVDQESGNSTFKYKVDGIDVELTEKDKRKAQNWNLTNKDWVKYKYVMEFMPRGLWTPDLDPPLVLAYAAENEQERMHYIKVQSQLEQARMKRDALVTSATTRYAAMQNPKTPEPMSAFKSQLSTNKDTLRSVFVPLNNCDAECKKFVTLAIASSSSSTQLDMHFDGGGEREAKKWLASIGVDESRISRKQISISAMDVNPTYRKLKGDSEGPFFLNKTESGTTRSD